MQSFFQVTFSRQRVLETVSIAVVSIVCVLFYFNTVPSWILLCAIAFGLFPLLRTAFVDLYSRFKIGTELFITAAVLISLCGGEFLAGAIVLLIILIAEYIASFSTERVRVSIKSLIDEAPNTVVVKSNGTEQLVHIDRVVVGDIVLVRAGDKIAVDGVVIEGEASVNQSSITGESIPQYKTVGDMVFAGTFVETGALDVQVKTLKADTVLARIVALVEQAEQNQAPIEKFTDTIAAWLIPISFLFIAIVYVYTKDSELIIALLIFTSPAELGLATPMVTISAIARAAKEGILVKGGLYLETLAKVDTFVFDKTGTVTTGVPTVERIELYGTRFNQTQVLKYAASVDRRSGHPLARAILEHALKQHIELDTPSGFVSIHGKGVQATINGTAVLLGNSTLMNDNGITNIGSTAKGSQTVIHIAIDGVLAATFYLSDTIRAGTKEALEQLRNSGVKRLVMLSGDGELAVSHVAKTLGITDVHASVLPQDKIAIIAKLKKEGAIVAMVGDGVNDAPALAEAHVGIAMGAIGTQAAMEAADVVLMHDDLLKISNARAISKKAYRTIKENIYIGVGVVHVTGIILVLTHVIGPIEAAIIHLVPDTLVFINSVKLLKVPIS